VHAKNYNDNHDFVEQITNLREIIYCGRRFPGWAYPEIQRG